MAGCKTLLHEQDTSCMSVFQKYYQQIVLVNLDDVNEVVYDVTDNNHAIAFNLHDGTTGYRYRGNENVSLYSASFSKSDFKGQPLYSHQVNLPVIGVGVTTKLILKELDLANYFAAIQFRDGTVEIYGFENGLKTNDYDFEAQNGMSGIGLTLSSKFDEETVPYVYGGNSVDFDNKFGDIPQLLGGDFNQDFNNDFYIVEI